VILLQRFAIQTGAGLALFPSNAAAWEVGLGGMTHGLLQSVTEAHFVFLGVVQNLPGDL
jgi:hypothetical protein